MNQYGLIKENGVIKGYKMPEHDVHKKQFAERELKSRVTKEQLKYADIALNAWATWRFDSDGYGDSSCNISDGDRMPAESRLPRGVAATEIVEVTRFILMYMSSLGVIQKQYAGYIYLVYESRKKNEPLNHLFDRLNFDFSYKQFLNAKKLFAEIIGGL